jgi:uncharacterized repeat protein (TIGR01451 family)
MDRQKIRVEGLLFNTIPFNANEENIPTLLGGPLTATLPIVGAVRGIGGSQAGLFAFYGGRADISVSFDLDSIPVPGLSIDTLRTSLDLINPATSGMSPTIYYDSNTPGVVIDGNPDSIATTPVTDWYEIVGASGGFVTVGTADPGTGTITNYYLDDDTSNPNDTGDGVAFGDSGVEMSDPSGTVSVAQSLYVTLPGSGSMGSTVLNWSENPLQAATAVQILSNDHALTLAKTADSPTVAPGEYLTYTLTVLHSHPDTVTHGVVLSDVVPLGTTFITATGPYTLAGSTVEWFAPILANGAEWEVQLVVQIPATTTMKSVNNVTYAVRSEEVEIVWGTAVSTPIVPDDWAIYLPCVTKN